MTVPAMNSSKVAEGEKGVGTTGHVEDISTAVEDNYHGLTSQFVLVYVVRIMSPSSKCVETTMED